MRTYPMQPSNPREKKHPKKPSFDLWGAAKDPSTLYKSPKFQLVVVFWYRSSILCSMLWLEDVLNLGIGWVGPKFHPQKTCR